MLKIKKTFDAFKLLGEKYRDASGWIYFSLTNGYKDKEKNDIRMAIVDKYTPLIDRYCDWYCTQGLTLPEPFELKPGDWTNILRKIQFSFVSLYEDPETEITEDIKEGFELFGKYFVYLTDPKYNGESD